MYENSEIQIHPEGNGRLYIQKSLREFLSILEKSLVKNCDLLRALLRKPTPQPSTCQRPFHTRVFANLCKLRTEFSAGTTEAGMNQTVSTRHDLSP